MLSNEQICNNAYNNSIIENFVCNTLGDFIPNMRDDLINRMNHGEGFIKRHFNAYTTPDNWKLSDVGIERINKIYEDIKDLPINT